MYLVRTKNGDKFVETANEVKNFEKDEVIEVYTLTKTEYELITSTSDIRDCIYKYLKCTQRSKEDVLDYVSGQLGIRKTEVSKVITKMKKEKIIYTEVDFGWLGID